MNLTLDQEKTKQLNADMFTERVGIFVNDAGLNERHAINKALKELRETEHVNPKTIIKESL
jgi:hypothetical protein